MARRDVLRVRVDHHELMAVDRLAAQRGLDRSALIRTLIREAGAMPPAPPPTTDELLAAAATLPPLPR
jgi:hypothetical protein